MNDDDETSIFNHWHVLQIIVILVSGVMYVMVLIAIVVSKTYEVIE